MLPCQDPEPPLLIVVRVERRSVLSDAGGCPGLGYCAALINVATDRELARTRDAGNDWLRRGRALARRRGWKVAEPALGSVQRAYW